MSSDFNNSYAKWRIFLTKIRMILMLTGRVKYTFTSFWNRNQSFRILQDALTRYQARLQAEKKVCTAPCHFVLVNLHS
jgi:hypothetical protein